MARRLGGLSLRKTNNNSPDGRKRWEVMTYEEATDSSTMDLLPCPFCGTDPDVRFIGNAHTKSRRIKVRCSGCRIERTDAAIRYGFEWLRTVAEKNWNQRPENKEV